MCVCVCVCVCACVCVRVCVCACACLPHLIDMVVVLVGFPPVDLVTHNVALGLLGRQLIPGDEQHSGGGGSDLHNGSSFGN